MNTPPKILILSEAFQQQTGGGITLCNLFNSYPKSKLANAVAYQYSNIIDGYHICDNYYSLGNKESVFCRPFSFLNRKGFSGVINNDAQLKNNKFNCIQKKKSNGFFKKLYSIIKYFGVNHWLYKYKISKEFASWLNEFQPDFIYTQLSSRELILFSNDLLNFTKAKLIIHIMDDWPNTIGKNNILWFFWEKKIDSEFRTLLSKASILLSISEGMSLEYKLRYNKVFYPFHNPINVDTWKSVIKKPTKANVPIRIIYAGRLGLANKDSLLEFSTALQIINKHEIKCTLQVYSPDSTTRTANLLRQKGVTVFPNVQHEKIPEIICNADFLLLSLDFSKHALKFAKYSMPTKASEYMISGVPIILFCSPELFLYKHAFENRWAFIIENNEISYIVNKLYDIIDNKKEQQIIKSNAMEYALNKYSSNIVTEKLFNLIYLNDEG